MTHRRLRPSDLVLPIIVSLTCLAASPNAEDPPSRQAAKDDLKKFQGTWECVSMEREGDVIPPESYKGSTAVYEDDGVTLYRDGEVFRRGVVTLDPSRSPKRINTWDQSGPYADETVPGIYEVDGDTMKICFSRPKVARPAEFTTKKEPGFLYCVYKRKKS